MINQIEAISKEVDKHDKCKSKPTLAVGSVNPIKIQAVKNALGENDMVVIGTSTSSGVRSQPLSEEETRQGAINRAKNSLHKTEADYGIGLEAGVFFINDDIYLCHWGALVDSSENIYISNTPAILLPNKYRNALLAGKDLGEIMRLSTGVQDLGAKEGAIGVFTNNRLNRKQLLTEVVVILLAQHHYYQQNPYERIETQF